MGRPLKKNTSSQLLKFYFAIICCTLIIAYSVFLWFPEYIYFIIDEDHLVENISAFSYLLAFFLGVWVLRNYSSWKKITWLVIIVGLIGFLDELSFGLRFMEFKEPEILGKNINAIHDFFFIGYIYFTDMLGFYGVLFLVLASIAGITFLYFKQNRYKIRDFIGDPFRPPGLFLVLFFLLNLTAQVADLKGFIIPLIIMEELNEMFAGIALCLYSISLAEMLQISESSEIQIQNSVDDLM